VIPYTEEKMLVPEAITKKIRIVDLSRCLLCNTCEKSCKSRHGFERNVRNGVRIGHVVMPYACKGCDDPLCMSSCRKGAIKRDEETGCLYLEKESCIGCGQCARKCPFGSILMEETGRFRETKDKEGNVKKLPVKYANRCDRCRGYRKKGCFSNCPGGVLKVMPFNEVLKSLPPIHQEKLKKLFLNGSWMKDEEEVESH